MLHTSLCLVHTKTGNFKVFTFRLHQKVLLQFSEVVGGSFFSLSPPAEAFLLDSNSGLYLEHLLPAPTSVERALAICARLQISVGVPHSKPKQIIFIHFTNISNLFQKY